MSKDKKTYNLEKLEEILSVRGKEWPERTKSWYIFQEEIEQLFTYLKINSELKKDKEEACSEKEVNTLIRNPIFICGNEKSGTTLLTQLFDGHKNIFTLPGVTHLINKYFANDYFNIETEAEYWLSRIINPTGQEPFFPYGKIISVYQNFLDCFYQFANKEKNKFNAILKSFILATKKNQIKELQYWVEKTPLNELKTQKIQTLYPNAKFINIIRDPVQNILSIKRLHEIRKRHGNIVILSLFQVFLYEKSVKNAQTIKKYKLIYYEKLLEDTKNQMQNLCMFLNIKYDDILTVPTVNNLDATANSMYKNKREKGKIVKKDIQKKPCSELNKKELIILTNILSVNKDFSKIITNKYPELKKYRNIIFILISKLTYSFYKIYRLALK